MNPNLFSDAQPAVSSSYVRRSCWLRLSNIFLATATLITIFAGANTSATGWWGFNAARIATAITTLIISTLFREDLSRTRKDPRRTPRASRKVTIPLDLSMVLLGIAGTILAIWFYASSGDEDIVAKYDECIAWVPVADPTAAAPCIDAYNSRRANMLIVLIMYLIFSSATGLVSLICAVYGLVTGIKDRRRRQRGEREELDVYRAAKAKEDQIRNSTYASRVENV